MSQMKRGLADSFGDVAKEACRDDRFEEVWPGQFGLLLSLGEISVDRLKGGVNCGLITGSNRIEVVPSVHLMRQVGVFITARNTHRETREGIRANGLDSRAADHLLDTGRCATETVERRARQCRP